MNPLGAIVGAGLAALIAVLLPTLGLITLVWLLVKRATRRAAMLIGALAAGSVLLPERWMPWNPALPTFDRAALLACYIFAAVLPWILVVYVGRKLRNVVTNGG